MSRHWLLIGLVGFGLNVVGEHVFAQTRTGTNTGTANQGSFGTNPYGGMQQGFGNNGNIGTTNSAFGQTQFGTSQLGTSGLGSMNSGLGNTGSSLGRTGTTGTTGTNRLGTTTNSLNSNQFQTTTNGLNGNTNLGNTQQNGLGQQQQLGTQQGATGRNATRNAFGGGQRSLFGQQFNAFSAFNALNGNQQQSGTIQPSLQLGFAPPTRAPEVVAERVESRMQTIANRPSRLGIAKPELKNVDTAMSNDGVITLSGKVPTASARRLAENMVRLEPGVRKIVNELQVEDAK